MMLHKKIFPKNQLSLPYEQDTEICGVNMAPWKEKNRLLHRYDEKQNKSIWSEYYGKYRLCKCLFKKRMENYHLI